MCIACVDDHAAELVCEERLPDYLRQTHLFQDLTDRQIEEVVAGTRITNLEDGHGLFSQGDSARWFYVLRAGHIALFRQSAEGRESIIAIVGPDEVFGEELLFLESASHDLNARAVGECTLLCIDRQRFRSFLKSSPSLGFRLMGTLYRRQKLLLDHIERLTLQDATQRLMAYLLDQVGDDGGPQRLELALPKGTLAAHLSIQPETLSRILTRLKECDYLHEEGDALIVQTEAMRAGLMCQRCEQRWGCPGPGRLYRDPGAEEASSTTATAAR
ncbi:MAG: Crp/Fnr family transcriptional regulator [bacterium]|nr:Crp/Fnr family transcriptional regulator [bacterium]